jgi:hypothetical protein
MAWYRQTFGSGMNTSKQSLLVFMQFLYRDYIVRKKHLIDNIINYTCIYPVLFGMQTAYFQSNTYFGSNNIMQNTILFAGNIVLVIMIFTYKQNIGLLFDFENKRFIDYQILMLNPFLVLCERILFTGLYSFILMAPFYPISAYIFADYIDMSSTCWWKLYTILLLGSLCMSAYHVFAACLLESSKNITSLWHRANNIMLSFGGFWIPFYVLYAFSPVLGYLAYLNPCIYITEGIKGSITGNPLFIPFHICASMLIAFIVLITVWAWVVFKRRTDCL